MPRKKPSKPKRSYGDGAVRQIGKYWWIDLPDGEGGRIRESSGSEQREDALDLLAQRRRELRRGELISIENPGVFTIGEVLEKYFHHRAGKLAPGTKSTYRSQIDKHLLPAFGLLPVAKLTTDMLSDYREARKKEIVQCGSNAREGKRTAKRKMSDTSINREVGLLRSALRDASKRWPSKVPKLPYFPMESESGNVRTGFLSPDRFDHLFHELPRHLKAPLACGFAIGGRWGEWSKLDWPDIDFDRMMIRFRKTKNKDDREVPIVPGPMLDSLLEARKTTNLLCPEEPAVFTYDGKRLKNVGLAWDKACERAGVPGLHYHDLRRSASRGLRNSGVSREVRKKIMGHRTDSMDDRYGIVDDADIREAAEKLSAKTRLKRIG